MRPALVLLVTGLLFSSSRGQAEPPPVEFEGHADIGTVKRPGSFIVTPDRREYRLTAAGANVWATEDAFHFAFRKAARDLTLTATVGWVGPGKNAHRKAGWMVRQGPEADAAYADAVVHGDGLISLQYRRIKGGPTAEVKAPVKGPAAMRLERDGDLFTLSVARPGEDFRPAGSVTVRLTDPVLVGLMACSHEADVTETAILSNVTFANRVPEPGVRRMRETSLEVVSIETGERRVVYRARDEFEAPNWSPDGKLFYVNRRGGIDVIPVAGGEPRRLDLGGVGRCNNDHGLSPDGKWLAISHHVNGPSLISVVPSGGGTPRLVTPRGPSYWHGWSPDGKTLAYCAERGGNFDVYTVPVEGGEERRLTDAPGLDDGPDYTPDGKQIYWNSVRSGLMKIWRMNADGSHPESVTTDADSADWFPHPSPDGKWLVFLSYDKSVTGHPANQDVLLRIMPLAGGKPKVLATLFGGQGTINVPSWSPDSKSVAFVSYRLVLP